MITVALVGEMKASGLTPKQLEAQLTEALKEQTGKTRLLRSPSTK